ncbi:MAG: IS481 family transposase [Acidobacteriota bacterium]|nr:IS481 family transposase [Acidobacteriota bacterium]
MKHKIKARLEWVKLYEITRNAGLVCRRCGISRPTLRKWWRRFRQNGIAGLEDLSRRPHNSPKRKIFEIQTNWISELRKRRLGSRRIQNELLRNYNFSLSRATLAKVLRKLNVAPLKKSRIPRKHRFRYERPIPGERVQIDTCKIAPGLYQYTAIDDCTRIRCLALFNRRTAANSLIFLEQICEEMPFPIQRIQTDRGREFFAYKFQKKLKEYAIKFRPIKPRSPHLNGKVERSQRTDLEEFYPTVDLKDPDLRQKLADWQDYYNEFRPHGSLGGKTPREKWGELFMQTPYHDEVEAMFDESKERLRLQNYRDDLYCQKLKLSL